MEPCGHEPAEHQHHEQQRQQRRDQLGPTQIRPHRPVDLPVQQQAPGAPP
jgi:hypothetical protein